MVLAVALQQVTAGAGRQPAAYRLVVVVHGEQQDVRARRLLAQPPRHDYSVQYGQGNVQNRYVWMLSDGKVQGGLPVSGFTADFPARMALYDVPDAAADDFMVVCD